MATRTPVQLDAATLAEGQVAIYRDDRRAFVNVSPKDAGLAERGAGQPAGTIARSYTFATDLAGWTTTDVVKQPIAHGGGAMVVSTTSPDDFHFAFETATGDANPYEVEADLTIASGTGGSLIFDHAGESDFRQVLLVTGNGLDPGAYVIGGGTGPMTLLAEDRSIRIAVGLTNRLLIRRTASTVSTFLNGSFLFACPAAGSPASRVGFSAIDGSVRVDNVRIYSLE